MSVKFVCLSCGAEMEAEDSWIGMEAECVNCQGSVIVPGRQTAASHIPSGLSEPDFSTDEDSEVQKIEPEGWMALGGGLILAIIVSYLPLVSGYVRYLKVLIHELGHSFFAWIFGFFSIPSFNFTHGGGVAYTYFNNRLIWLVALVYLFFAWLIYLNRKNFKAMGVVLGVMVVYSVIAFTTAYKTVVVFMGCGMELVFAGIFFYRAISGRSIVNPLERPLYGFCAFFLEFQAIIFAYRLLANPVERIIYERGLTINEGHTNDFVILAKQHLNCPMTHIVIFFLCCCALPPLMSFLFHRYRNFILSSG